MLYRWITDPRAWYITLLEKQVKQPLNGIELRVSLPSIDPRFVSSLCFMKDYDPPSIGTARVTQGSK